MVASKRAGGKAPQRARDPNFPYFATAGVQMRAIKAGRTEIIGCPHPAKETRVADSRPIATGRCSGKIARQAPRSGRESASELSAKRKHVHSGSQSTGPVELTTGPENSLQCMRFT
jgi:hypothetical protein